MNSFTIKSHSTPIIVIGTILGAFIVPLTVVYGIQDSSKDFLFFIGSFFGLLGLSAFLIFLLSGFKIKFTIQSNGLDINWLQRTLFRSSKSQFVLWSEIKYYSVLPTSKREGIEIDIFFKDGRKVHVVSHNDEIYDFRDALENALDTQSECGEKLKKPKEIDFFLTNKALYLSYFCLGLTVVFTGFLIYIFFFDTDYRSVNMPLYPFIAWYGIIASIIYKVYKARKNNRLEMKR